MKKIINFFIHKPIYIIFLIIIVIYLPNGLSAPPEGVDRQHASTIGIDLSDNGIELSLLSYISQQSETFTKKYLLISVEAENVSKALDQIANISGRKVAITHATVLVISEELAISGAEKYLDFFYRNENLTNDTFLICAKGSAKDLLKFEKEKVNSTGVGLEEMATYNARNWFFVDTNIENFFKGYFSPTKSTILSMVELEDNPDNEQLGASSSGSASGASSPTSASGQSGDSSSGASSSGSKKIKSMQDLGIVRDGKLVNILSPDLAWATTIINPKTAGNSIYLENYNDENIKNSTVIFSVEKNNVTRRAFFETNHPVLQFDIFVIVSIDEILSNESKKEYFDNNINFLTETMKGRLELKAKEKFSKLLSVLVEHQSDIIGTYNTLHDQLYDKFLDWYNNLEDKNDFLRYVEFRITVHSALTK